MEVACRKLRIKAVELEKPQRKPISSTERLVSVSSSLAWRSRTADRYSWGVRPVSRLKQPQQVIFAQGNPPGEFLQAAFLLKMSLHIFQGQGDGAAVLRGGLDGQSAQKLMDQPGDPVIVGNLFRVSR